MFFKDIDAIQYSEIIHDRRSDDHIGHRGMLLIGAGFKRALT